MNTNAVQLTSTFSDRNSVTMCCLCIEILIPQILIQDNDVLLAIPSYNHQDHPFEGKINSSYNGESLYNYSTSF